MGSRLVRFNVPGGRRAIQWLLRDEFTTAASAPLTSPRTAEPGPGALTLVQTDGQLSISSDDLVFPVQTTPAWGDQGWYGPAEARVTGKALIVAMRQSTLGNIIDAAWFQTAALNTTSTNNQASSLANGNAIIYWQIQGLAIETGLQANTDYQFALVLRSTGSFALVKGGIFTTWTLLWVGATDTTTPVYPGMSNYNSAGTQDFVRVRQLSGQFATDNGIASVSQDTATSGTDYTATADAIHDLTVTAPNPLANSATLEYRVTDSDNKWVAYLNNAGAFRADSVAAGVATNRVNVAGVATAGNPYTIRVKAVGAKHNYYTYDGAVATKRGSEIDLSHQDSATTIKPIATGSWILGALRSYPRTSSAYEAELDKV